MFPPLAAIAALLIVTGTTLGIMSTSALRLTRLGGVALGRVDN